MALTTRFAPRLPPMRLQMPPDRLPITPTPDSPPGDKEPDRDNPDAPPAITDPSLPGEHAPVRDPQPPRSVH